MDHCTSKVAMFHGRRAAPDRTAGAALGVLDDVRTWIYLVTFERQYHYQGRTLDARGTLVIPVLLDGRVIQGKTE